MLVPFVIDADSLQPDPGWTPTMVSGCYIPLIEVAQEFGLLVHDGERLSESNFYQAIERLPPKIRMLLLGFLKWAPTIPAPQWDGTVAAANLQAAPAVARLALVDDVRAEAEFGLSDDETEVPAPTLGDIKFWICRLMMASNASPFKEARKLAEKSIAIGEKYDKIWDERFKGLASAPLKKISIVDRYAIQNHMECPRSQLSGLVRFLRLLNRDAVGARHVKIYSEIADTPSRKIEETAKKLKDDLRFEFERMDPRNIKTIRVILGAKKDFSKFAHDRFVRFEHYVWDIGVGLEILDGPAAKRPTTMSFRAGDIARQECLEVEQILERRARLKFLEIS